MKKQVLHILLMAGVLFCCDGCVSARTPEPMLHRRLLWATPLGTTMTDVHKYILRRGWKGVRVEKHRGFWYQGLDKSKARIIGSQNIEANIGDYRPLLGIYPLEANTTVFWGFDEQDRLIDIWVWKTIDGP